MSEWQPIETAPKDGTVVLMHDGFGVVAASYNRPYTFEEFKKCIGEDDDTIEDFHEWEAQERIYASYDDWSYFPFCDDETITQFLATHWMPLPEPPYVPKG